MCAELLITHPYIEVSCYKLVVSDGVLSQHAVIDNVALRRPFQTLYSSLLEA